MKRINNNELKKINGGISVGVVIVVSALISFVAGIISGIANPEPCKK